MESMFLNSSNMTNITANSTQIFPTSPTTTSSDPANPANTLLKWVHIISYSIICLSGICGNLLVILASRKPSMITVSNVLIANLAAADFTVCLVNIPTVAAYGYLVYWPFGAFLCKLISFLQGLTLSASVGTLAAIAGERYWHIVLYTRRKLTIREAFKAIAVIWASSIFMPLPLTVFSKTTMFKQGNKELTICIEEWPSVESRQAYTTLLFLLLYFFPLLLISGLYVQIGRFLRSLPATQQVTNQVQGKAIRMLSTVVLLFGLCWLPYHIVYMYLDWNQSQLNRALTSFILFSQWLVFANSACNPFVYAVLNENYRREFAVMVYRRQARSRRSRGKNNTLNRVQTVQSGV